MSKLLHPCLGAVCLLPLAALVPASFALAVGRLEEGAAARAPHGQSLPKDASAQARIEQRFSIRISPGSAAMPPSIVLELEQSERQGRAESRKLPRCLPAAAFAGVQSVDGSHLLLFMRDSHVVAAQMQKTCNAHDFYSGFYVERNPDGMLCVGRDKLQARSGASCTIRGWQSVVETPARRIP
jgi:hypothetical protein